MLNLKNQSDLENVLQLSKRIQGLIKVEEIKKIDEYTSEITNERTKEEVNKIAKELLTKYPMKNDRFVVKLEGNLRRVFMEKTIDGVSVTLYDFTEEVK